MPTALRDSTNTPRETTREKFIKAALELIHKKGFKATTMREIAAKVGCDVANIYNYTESKQTLLEHFIFEISDEFHAGMKNIQDSSYSPSEKIRELVDLHIELIYRHPHQTSVLFNEWRNLEKGKIYELRQARKEYEKEVMSIIQEGIDLKEFHLVDLEIAAQTVLSSVRWLYDWYFENSDHVNKLELRKEISSMLLRSLQIEKVS